MDTPDKVIAKEDLQLSLSLEPVYSQSFGTKEQKAMINRCGNRSEHRNSAIASLCVVAYWIVDLQVNSWSKENFSDMVRHEEPF